MTAKRKRRRKPKTTAAVTKLIGVYETENTRTKGRIGHLFYSAGDMGNCLTNIALPLAKERDGLVEERDSLLAKNEALQARVAVLETQSIQRSLAKIEVLEEGHLYVIPSIPDAPKEKP
jgi:hypothetical protein